MSPRLPLLTLFGAVFISATASATPSANEAAILKIEQAMAAAQSAAEVLPVPVSDAGGVTDVDGVGPWMVYLTPPQVAHRYHEDETSM